MSIDTALCCVNLKNRWNFHFGLGFGGLKLGKTRNLAVKLM